MPAKVTREELESFMDEAFKDVSFLRTKDFKAALVKKFQIYSDPAIREKIRRLREANLIESQDAGFRRKRREDNAGPTPTI